MQSVLSNYAGSGSSHTAQRLFSTFRIERELACHGAVESGGNQWRSIGYKGRKYIQVPCTFISGVQLGAFDAPGERKDLTGLPD